jgi:nicotinate-nucleotide adenylyltransferase
LNVPVGLFGGTFDPVHRGHLQVAEEVRSVLELDDFRMLPAADPPHRRGTHASAGHRLAMLELALADHPHLTIDRRELDREGPSWMVVTLESLRREQAERPLLLVLGQDSANSLDRWHRWRELIRLAHLVIMTRPGQSPGYSAVLAESLAGREVRRRAELFSAPAGRVLHLEVTPLHISSTQVRTRAGEGRSLTDLVPDAVAAYIERHGLYGAADAGGLSRQGPG